jgi:uncharacterized membrane protein
MGASRQDLERWVEAGLIQPEQADAIAAHEATRPDGRPGRQGQSRRAPRPPRRSLAAEAVGYVGAALAVGAVGLLVADTWDGLRHGGRLALVALLAVALGGAAAATSRQGRAPLQRLTSVLLTGVVAAVAWFVALVAAVDLGARGARVAVLSAGAALLVAAPLYAWRRRPLPQATVLVPVVALAVASLSSVDLPPPAWWYGLVLWAIGVAWALAGHGGWLPPAPLAGALGGVVALLGVQVASFEGARAGMLTLGVVSAALAVAVAVWHDTPHHLAVGAVGLFLLVPQLVFELFGDAIGAPATLLVVGLLLVLLAVGIGRVRRQVAPGGTEEVAR